MKTQPAAGANSNIIPLFGEGPKTAHVRNLNPSSQGRVLQFPNLKDLNDPIVVRWTDRRPKTDEEWYRALGARLRAFRIQRGASVKDAAAVAGRSVETWLNYERSGRGHITWPILQFAKHYGISLDDLIRD